MIFEFLNTNRLPATAEETSRSDAGQSPESTSETHPLVQSFEQQSTRNFKIYVALEGDVSNHTELISPDRLFPCGTSKNVDEHKFEILESVRNLDTTEPKVDEGCTTSCGRSGIVIDGQRRVGVDKVVSNLIDSPVHRARSYLQRNSRRLFSVLSTGATLKENFAQLLILEATRDPNLVSLFNHEREWNFLQGNPTFTTQTYPCDLDMTSFAFTIISRPKEVTSSVMNEMLKYVNKDGIVQTYFDHNRVRIDPTVCLNVLTLFHINGRGHELPRTFDWVRQVLVNHEYAAGTRYYCTPECFLFFMSRFLERIKGTKADLDLRPIFVQRVQETIGTKGDALALAMRILACASVWIRDETVLDALLALQNDDGGWDAGWIYKYVSSGIGIGNRGLTTALAINAIEALKKSDNPSYELEFVETTRDEDVPSIVDSTIRYCLRTPSYLNEKHNAIFGDSGSTAFHSVVILLLAAILSHSIQAIW